MEWSLITNPGPFSGSGVSGAVICDLIGSPWFNSTPVTTLVIKHEPNKSIELWVIRKIVTQRSKEEWKTDKEENYFVVKDN